MKNNKTLKIIIRGGMLEYVDNLPKGWDYELVDWDGLEEDGYCHSCEPHYTCPHCQREQMEYWLPHGSSLARSLARCPDCYEVVDDILPDSSS